MQSVTEQHNDKNETDAGDAEQAKHAHLLSWMQGERDVQSENRLEMARDGDYYDGLQWPEDEARAVEARGQVPAVYNNIKIAIDWIIGTEKRNRVDWKVLPREESDVEGAGTKTKVLKYISDVNRVPFVRSQAFSEAAICGLSFMEDSLNSDVTEDVLFFGHQSWREVLHDSYHKRLDGKDMRYVFRWRYLDLDVAQALLPKHADHLEAVAMDAEQITQQDEDAIWYMGQRLAGGGRDSVLSGTRHVVSINSMVHSSRKRVKIIECWYKEPMTAKVMQGGIHHGSIYDPNSASMKQQVDSWQADVTEGVILRVRQAIFTERGMILDRVTPFSHNEFPLTPIYCFRRQRDGMPYGHVRQIRDPQDDLNKRMSKSLFLLSVNQLVTEKSAFDEEGEYTLQDAIDNASNPNGVFVLRDGSKKFEIRRDYAEMQGQMQLVAMDKQFIQSGSGVTDELLGRKTNAVSGTAITARQEQGSTSTAGIFDNYRLAISLSGQKQLSNAEKFYSLPKVIRLTEPKSDDNQEGLAWTRINQPEVQPDGSVRFINDITETKADFIVDEQDYRASMRQSMFESLMGLIQHIAPIAPQIAVGMLDLLVGLNDFPGKEEMVARIKSLVANSLVKPTTPQEAQAQQEQQIQAQAEAAQQAELANRAAASEIAKNEADAEKKDAEANKVRAETAQISATVIGLQPTMPVQQPAPMDNTQGAALTAPQQMPSAQQPPMAMQQPVQPQQPLAPVAQPVSQEQVADIGAGVHAVVDGTEAAIRMIRETQQQAEQSQAVLMRLIQETRQETQLATQAIAQEFGHMGEALRAIQDHSSAQLEASLAKLGDVLGTAMSQRQSPTSKRITLPGPDGKPITATIEPIERTDKPLE